MFAGLSRLQKSYSVFRWHKRLRPLKNRTRGFFVVRQIAKIFLGKTVLKRTRKGSSFWAQNREQVGGNAEQLWFWRVRKIPLKVIFFTWSMNCFICISTRMQSSQVLKRKRVKIGRWSLTNRRSVCCTYIPKEVFSCSILCLTYGSGTSTMYGVCTDLGIVLLVVCQPLPNLLIFCTMTLSSEFA